MAKTDEEELMQQEWIALEKRTRGDIVGGLWWSFICFVLGFIFYKTSMTNQVVWFCLIMFFVAINIYTLYKSLDYIDRFDYVAIGVVGAAVSGVFLLLIVAVLVVIIMMAAKSGEFKKE